MDLNKILAELHEQLRKINEAIASLEALDAKRPTPSSPDPPRKRGRPRKSPVEPDEGRQMKEDR
jgi:hypothetical protein